MAGVSLPVISTYSIESAGSEFQTYAATLHNTTSRTWATANTAIALPFVVETSFVCANGLVHNGAAVSGNLDIGIYTTAFAKVASSGSVAQAGVNTLQLVTLSTTLAAGEYYMVLALDNVVGTVFGNSPTAPGTRLWKGFTMAAAFPLPATLTPAANSTVTNMVYGITSRSFA